MTAQWTAGTKKSMDVYRKLPRMKPSGNRQDILTHPQCGEKDHINMMRSLVVGAAVHGRTSQIICGKIIQFCQNFIHDYPNHDFVAFHGNDNILSPSYKINFLSK